MVNLTKHFKTTKHLIDGGEVTLNPRPYLGMSQLGHSCPRYLWYSFRWAYVDKTTKRMTRLWARGHREEPEIWELLRGIGYKVWGDQTEMQNCFGHVQGHCDGMVSGVVEAPKTDHLLEIKTASDSKFKKYKKTNDLAKSHPVYYAQTQLYMHHLGLTRTLWIVVNKNDDDIHIERIRYNKDHAEELLRKAEHVFMAGSPPRRPFPRTYFECKWCAAKPTCWDKAPMQRNCRTCQHVGIEMEGKWSCGLSDEALPEDFQRVGCSKYNAIEQD